MTKCAVKTRFFKSTTVAFTRNHQKLFHTYEYIDTALNIA